MELYGRLPALRDGDIRLLRVHAMSETPKNIIRCTLTTHNLSQPDNKLDFLALSYTWGPPHYSLQELRTSRSSISHQVQCNGNMIDVSENLGEFLCHCASADEDQGLSGYMWIDALSINQWDIFERSRQVNFMGEIYKTATRVVVWLGIEDRTTKSAFDLIVGLSTLTPAERSKLHPHEVRPQHANPLLDIYTWNALALFFRKTWFNRAWIIQEVVFARDVNGQWHNTPARLDAAKRTYETSTNEGLLYALIRARSSSCQDPRDKVYSQLGLGKADIFPDYDLAVADVYITAARYILENSNSLLLLTCVEGDEFQKIPGLPSWIPDWSVTQFLGLRVTGYRHFHASGHRPRQYSLSMQNDKPVLGIQATNLDDIVEICDIKGDLRDGLHNSSLWKTISSISPRYITGEGREEVRIQYPATSERLEPSFRDWIIWRYVMASEEPVTFPIRSSADSILPSPEEIQDARRRSREEPDYLNSLIHRASFFDLHYSHAKLVRPFRTREGYFGIGTQCLREHDSVWVVPGCPVPLILRRTEGSEMYRLVGGSYVHGFMDGEILERKDLAFEMVGLE
ncbi:hypothetical protein EJ02DRAFT_369686 [Clathrospora elynae]|uniref:Heterokaryon incompatibility domain-containing protein n=1 Tax=Clathrospora elynae TaxID=706981 RepID=A0A6A5T031_9PLEO|nr:hypothetical protein EJ02DRAFT_369686 [Clathrospora elynae]